MTTKTTMKTDEHGRAELKISVRRTRNYGVESIEFGIEKTIFADSAQDIIRHYDASLKALAVEIEEYEKNHLPDVRPSGNQPMVAANAPANDLDTFAVDEIRREMQGGAERWKVCGGRWKKWGVALYIEDFEEGDLPFTASDYGFGNHDVSDKGWQATAEMLGGVPKRIKGID